MCNSIRRLHLFTCAHWPRSRAASERVGARRRGQGWGLLASHADKLTEDGRHRLVRQQLGRPRIAQDLEAKILAALMAPGRTEGVRKIAKRFGVDPGTVQRISRPFDSAGAAA